MGETKGSLLNGDKGSTGTAYEAMSGFELTFMGEEANLAQEVSPTLMPSLIVAAP